MGDGPSEMILLIAGLIVAALVSGVLLQSWDDMSGVLDQRGKQGMEDVKTRVSLANDPINIGWDPGNDTAVIHLQNSGDSFLDVEDVGIMLNGSAMTVTKWNGITEWLPGEIVEFTISGAASGLDFFPDATYDVHLAATVVSTSGSYAGLDTLREVVRIAS